MPTPPMKVTPVVCVCGDHAFANLSRGFVTIVSPADAHFLERKWSTTGNRARVAAGRDVWANGMPRRIFLSREILAATAPAVDHKNGNTLDNRRENLRECTLAENSRNRRPYGKMFGLKGVSRAHGRGTFEAQITIDGKNTYLGRFRTAEEAHAAYCAAAHRLHGEFARFE